MLTTHSSLLEIKEGGFSYQPNLQPLFSQVNIQFSHGHIVSILGPSGCGKSTLLKCLAQLIPLTQGQIISHAKQKSFVFQEAALLPWGTVYENVKLGLTLTGIKNSKIELDEKISNILNKFKILKYAHLYPHQLSGGIKMRTQLARAFVVEPQLLFLDEPFSALDEPTRETLQEEVRDFAITTGCSTLFVTHSIEEACFVSDEIYLFTPNSSQLSHFGKLRLPSSRHKELRTAAEYFYEVKRLRQLILSWQKQGDSNEY